MAVNEAPATKKFFVSRAVLKMRITHSRVRTYASKRYNTWAAGWMCGGVFWLGCIEIQRFFG